ncbi:MAG: TIGR02147 family protein [Bdellovibrionota bacterium]
MVEQAAVQQLLRDTFHQGKMRNQAYSIRSFSKRLGLSSGAVSSILGGRRRISKKLAAKILEKVDADPKTRAGILGLFPDTKSSSPAIPKKSVQLNQDQFQLVSKSVHYEILCLLETGDFREDYTWMAGRLLHTPSQIAEALERLVRLGMVKRTASGKLSLTGELYESSDGIPAASIRQSHFESLEQARRSLEQDAVEDRDFSSETMAIDPDLLPAARRLLRDVRRKLNTLFESGQKKEVYKVSIQLFPLSQLKKSGRK